MTRSWWTSSLWQLAVLFAAIDGLVVLAALFLFDLLPTPLSLSAAAAGFVAAQFAVLWAAVARWETRGQETVRLLTSIDASLAYLVSVSPLPSPPYAGDATDTYDQAAMDAHVAERSA